MQELKDLSQNSSLPKAPNSPGNPCLHDFEGRIQWCVPMFHPSRAQGSLSESWSNNHKASQHPVLFPKSWRQHLGHAPGTVMAHCNPMEWRPIKGHLRVPEHILLYIG
jgi:hypothetical protein